MVTYTVGDVACPDGVCPLAIGDNYVTVRVTAEGASAPPGDQLNGLVGRALRLSRGVQRDEVAVAVAGGLRLVGFAARPNRLRAGSHVTAWVDESAVVIALA